MAKTSSKVILAGLTGLAAGIVVGVLIAPCKGSKTRKKLKKKIRRFEDIIQQGDFSGTFDTIKSMFKKEKDEDPENEPPS